MKLTISIFVIILLLTTNQSVFSQDGTIGSAIPECTSEEMVQTARVIRPIATEIGLMLYQVDTASILSLVIQLNRLQVDLARQIPDLPRCAFAVEISTNTSLMLSELIIIALSPDDLFLTLREPWNDLVMEKGQEITDKLPRWWTAGLDGPPSADAVG